MTSGNKTGKKCNQDLFIICFHYFCMSWVIELFSKFRNVGWLDSQMVWWLDSQMVCWLDSQMAWWLDSQMVGWLIDWLIFYFIDWLIAV